MRQGLLLALEVQYEKSHALAELHSITLLTDRGCTHSLQVRTETVPRSKASERSHQTGNWVDRKAASNTDLIVQRPRTALHTKLSKGVNLNF